MKNNIRITYNMILLIQYRWKLKNWKIVDKNSKIVSGQHFFKIWELQYILIQIHLKEFNAIFKKKWL